MDRRNRKRKDSFFRNRWLDGIENARITFFVSFPILQLPISSLEINCQLVDQNQKRK